MPSAFHTPNEHNSSHKNTTEEFNKTGQLISTLMRTFYEASTIEEEDRRRRRSHGDSAEDGAVDVRSGPFRHRAILRARAAGGGEQDSPAGTSEHTDRASDLLRRERASVVVGTGVA
jgi:hypothetical protein